MANTEHVEIVNRGTEAIRAWRRQNPDTQLDLSEAEISQASPGKDDWARLWFAELNGANLHRTVLKSVQLIDAQLLDVDLSEAMLAGAHLNRADLSRANLRMATIWGISGQGIKLVEANLTGANLQNADLSGANLSGAILDHADIRGANLGNASLRAADLTGLCCGWSTFHGSDFSGCRGLESVRHFGPSRIDIECIYRSQGRITCEFLQNCGVPIGGAPEAVPFYSCFISYSHVDEGFAKRLHSRLRDEQLRVWFAPEDMKAGRKIHEQIEQAIHVHDKLLLVISEASMASEWVRTEVRHARQREVQEGRRILFPLRLAPFERIREWKAFDADTGKDIAVEIREYFIPDFSNLTDHGAFESAFERLLDDLKTTD